MEEQILQTGVSRKPQLSSMRRSALSSQRAASIPRVCFITAACLLCGVAAVWNAIYTSACVLTVDGTELGCLASRQAAESALAAADTWAAEFLDGPSDLSERVELSQVLTRRDALMETEEAESLLQERVDGLVDAWAVSLDGRRVGVVKDQDGLNDLLNTLRIPYVTADTVEAGFVQPVRITQTYAAEGKADELEAVRAALTADRAAERTYVVQPGDSVIGIAKAHGTTAEELRALNADKDLSLIVPGEELTVKAAVPLLDVRTVNHETYIDRLPVGTERVSTDELFLGEEDLRDSGHEGWAHYTADITYVNGEETSRKVDTVDPIVPSEDAIVLVGTKTPPAAEAVGTFAWPVKGTITSYFGKRFIFGSTSFHSGLDIASPNGTRIRAADGGVVTFAGEGEGINETLGLFVIIDHGNGYRTIYGHCSELEVSEGEHVYPGQTVARVGSTGRSTGNHLHFMVKRDGVNIDPLTVLPQK